ncbi:ABC transporter substrate-binding protein [Rhizobium sp. CG5]|uniref:ABC transporter substrate-binding protein n=1 Tax=Rhizobium sp. CG5 TaxID=2726076 RepID=UPI00203493AD|nr:ABC transporter substrate-binding protein [Rhizobium sp. CG5]MCM2476485.1 ABC transporter substrate-binding protein [Rhizobium sp. CG5]
MTYRPKPPARKTARRPLWSRTFGRLSVFAVALLAAVVTTAPAHAGITLTDVKGRTVTLEAAATRLVIDDGRIITALSYLAPDPIALVAGWPHDIDRLGREQYEAYRLKFPAIDSLSLTNSSSEDMAVEQVIAARPDLVVLSLYSRVAEQQLAQLEEAGIPAIYVDFVLDPLGNSDASFAVLGQAIGRSAQSAQMIAFRKAHLAAIDSRLAQSPSSLTPRVFLEAHAAVSEPCCNTPGTGNFGKVIDRLKARNIGDILKGRPFGQINIEYVIASKPEVYIASGGAYMATRGGLLIGPSFDRSTTEDSLRALLARPGFSALPAVVSGRVHGLAKQLFEPGMDILALEIMAKWLHPELFSDLDVEATRQSLNRMAAIPLVGTYWTE